MSSHKDLTYAYLEKHPIDAARVLEKIPAEAAASLLQSLPLRLAAPVLRQILPAISAHCLMLLDDTQIVGLLKGVGIQAGAAIIRQIDASSRARILPQLPTTHTIAYDLLLGYQEGTVGAWMDPHALTLTSEMTCGDMLDLIKRSKDASIATPFIIDHNQYLIGHIELADLLRANTKTSLVKLAKPSLHKLSAHALLLKLENHQGWRNTSSLPVIDHNNKLVGVMTYSALQRALSLEHNTIISQPDNENAVANIAEIYWLGVSSLIQAVIGLFPCAPRKGDV